ncbi:MAG: sigma-70 family RNA polymerase sigma factor [Selenomonadaceae bacterium]|nr:sigma-70 family RNA polymerase sigma factor [Selenomonadaceae bacterium]MBP3722468.1 sigma-70 family RNA polymerase sigma factor [Selenomonadaceae bacterium]
MLKKLEINMASTPKDAAYWNNLAKFAIEDEAALTEIYNFFFGKIYKFLLMKLRNTDAADDLAGNVFMKMYKSLDSFDPQKASFATWLNRITANEVKMYFRAKSRHDDKETSWDENFNPAADENLEPEKQVLSKERASEIKSALMTLPERERAVIEMTYWLNLKPKEIADSLGLTPNHVSVILRRAKQTLRDCLS